LIRTVSVVIPTRNSSSTIAAAVGCARGQVGVHVECLVVDDSSDDTRAVAVEAGAKVVPGQGRGVSAARNLGASVASGEFVAFLDADDQWAEDKLARQIALLDSDSALAMVGTQFRITGGIHGTRELRMSDAALRRYNAIEYLASPRLPASVFLVRTAVAQQVRFPVGISDGEDTIYAAEVRIHGLIGCVEEVLMTRHLRAGSLSNSPGHVSKNFLADLGRDAGRGRLGVLLARRLREFPRAAARVASGVAFRHPASRCAGATDVARAARAVAAPHHQLGRLSCVGHQPAAPDGARSAGLPPGPQVSS
jgi:glycosyltransferase involved in cell wall biosynthesis